VLREGQPFSAVAVMLAAFPLVAPFRNVRLETFDVTATQGGPALLSNFVPL
jgi:hypothetical protein